MLLGKNRTLKTLCRPAHKSFIRPARSSAQPMIHVHHTQLPAMFRREFMQQMQQYHGVQATRHADQ